MHDNVFIPEAATKGVRRPPGKWHPFMHTVALVALPVFYAAYLGVAEAAREAAIDMTRRKKNIATDDANLPYVLGEMENQLVTAQLAFASMVTLAETTKPGPQATSAALARRTILAGAAIRTVEKAMEAAGGGCFFRSQPLERLFRDIQGARFHPVPEKVQTRLTGRLLLGLDID